MLLKTIIEILNQLEKLEAAKADLWLCYVWLPFLNFGYLSISFLSFPFLSGSFLTFPYFSLLSLSLPYCGLPCLTWLYWAFIAFEPTE